GSSEGWPPAEQAARFDLIDASAGVAYSRVYASDRGNSWQTLKSLNPRLLVFIYQNGPCMYNTASWGQMGAGWDWVTQEHGARSSDRWTALGVRHQGYLQHRPYPNERMMHVGNPNWQEFWLKETYASFWSGNPAMAAGTDGIFADNSSYALSLDWYLEDQPESDDQPSDYVRDGAFRPELYRADMQAFFGRAVPWLEERQARLLANFGNMVREPESWRDLDALPHPPFAAMEEGAFVHPWGKLGREGNFVFWPEKEWLNQVETLGGLKHVRALMNVHGPVGSDARDIRRMDAADASGNRAWDVLWYALASFLQGYDDVRQNAYMNFTVWGYSRFYWFDEFDPKCLHLGPALGEFRRTDTAGGHLYLREFQDGWAAVNPTPTDLGEIAIPGGGQARVVNHDTLLLADQQPLVDRFDLASHRGVVLLKLGRKIGNADN
ncbi:MAG: alpha-amylase family protein, partial [Thermoguttaceae bacterium]